MADSLLDTDHSDVTAREEILNKWKDKPTEELLAAKVESDLFIKTLTTRMDDLKQDYLTLREEAQAKASLQELIDRMERPKTNDDTTQNTNREEVTPSYKPEDIEALVSKKIAESETTKKYNDNFNSIRSKLKEQFGDNASTILKQRMDTLGLTQEFADDLARKHPTVFMKTFGLDEQVRQDAFQTPVRNQQRAASFAPTTQKRDWDYYQELKKSDPRMYLDPKIAIQMHDDAIALGEAFGMPRD